MGLLALEPAGYDAPGKREKWGPFRGLEQGYFSVEVDGTAIINHLRFLSVAAVFPRPAEPIGLSLGMS